MSVLAVASGDAQQAEDRQDMAYRGRDLRCRLAGGAGGLAMIGVGVTVAVTGRAS